jgi:hypothetical protein
MKPLEQRVSTLEAAEGGRDKVPAVLIYPLGAAHPKPLPGVVVLLPHNDREDLQQQLEPTP